MRQSLSDPTLTQARHPSDRTEPAVVLALLGALVLAGAALVDQLGGQTLVDHAESVYAPHGKEVSGVLLYGLLYFVAAIEALLWLAVLWTARRASRWAAAGAGLVTVLGLGLAAPLLLVREYGEQVFPHVWGGLALLAPVIGAVAVARLLARRDA